MIDKDKYINSLENLLIYMCKTYVEGEQVLFKLAKEGNRALFEVPRMQTIAITQIVSQIADISFRRPEYGFKIVKEEILRKRKEDDKLD